MQAVLHVIYIGNRAIQCREVVVDGALFISSFAAHRVVQLQCPVVEGECALVVAPTIGIESQQAQCIYPGIEPVVLIRKRKRLHSISGRALAIVWQIGPHQRLVGIHQLLVAQAFGVLQRLLYRVGTRHAVVVVGKRRKLPPAKHDEQQQISMYVFCTHLPTKLSKNIRLLHPFG